MNGQLFSWVGFTNDQQIILYLQENNKCHFDELYLHFRAKSMSDAQPRLLLYILNSQ